MRSSSSIQFHLLLFLCFGIGFWGCQKSGITPEGNKVLLVSFDGFHPDYLSKTETPNFDHLVETGVISEGLIPIFPSKTFPNYYAIATGLYPENNGFIANAMYDSTIGQQFSMRNREAVENPNWYGGEPIWNTVEKQGKKAGTMFWVGSEAPIQDMRPTHWKPYDQSMNDSARVDSVIKWMSSGDAKEVDLATLYFHYPDQEGHRYGTESEEVKEAVRRADQVVGYLIQELESKGVKDRTNLLIVSDHGMANVSRERLIVLDDMIDPDDVEMIATSPAVMLNVKPEKRAGVYAVLKENEDHFQVYKKEDIPERYHLKNNPRVPELLLVADVGYTISTRDYVARRGDNYPSGGAHGFDNQAEEMRALFVANGPDLKSGYEMRSFENVHLYALMAHLLQVQPAKTDGTLDSVRVLLKDQY